MENEPRRYARACGCARRDVVDIAGFDVSGNTGSAARWNARAGFLRGLVAISQPIDRIVRSISFVHRDGGDCERNGLRDKILLQPYYWSNFLQQDILRARPDSYK